MILDAKFIKLLRKGDRKSQTLFYKQSFNFLMSIALRYKHNEDDAAFLVNKAFMKILSNIEKVDNSKSILAWMKRILINCAIDEFRKSAKMAKIIDKSKDIDDIHNSSSTSNIYLDTIQEEEVQRLLNTLPRATNNVFQMYAIDGYSYKEIMANLNISLSTAKWHVKEARKRLKILFKEKSKTA